MCGIVGAVAQRNVVPILIEGLRRLEYRGYDSAGMAVLTAPAPSSGSARWARSRAARALEQDPIAGLSASRTRAGPRTASRASATPTRTSARRLALVHNGIIENHGELRAELQGRGLCLHLRDRHRSDRPPRPRPPAEDRDLLEAVRATVADLDGAYALAVIPQKRTRAASSWPARAARVVIGLGEGENFVASDVSALLPVTATFIFLEEGDMAEIRRDSVRVSTGRQHRSSAGARERLSADAAEKGEYPALHAEGNLRAAAGRGADAGGARGRRQLLEAASARRHRRLRQDRAVHIVACGTSYHAGLGRRYLIEQICRLPCCGRDRERVPLPQSGGAQEHAVRQHLPVRRDRRHPGGPAAGQAGRVRRTLAICNVPESSLVRESELVMLTRAGPEIGVASTKAFTTQLTALGHAGRRAGRSTAPTPSGSAAWCSA